MAIEDKLLKTRFNLDAEPHIKVAGEICETCREQTCLYVCPVQNYVLRDGKVVFSWQGCVECGACRLVCTAKAITWEYPRGGFGVALRYG